MAMAMQKIGPDPPILFGDIADDDLTHAAVQFIHECHAIGAATAFVSDDGKIERSRWAVDIKRALSNEMKSFVLEREIETVDDVCELINNCVLHEVTHCQTTIRHSDRGWKWTMFLKRVIE